MTLGMNRGAISLILVIETFLIGLCSLVVGLFLGVFLSQSVSVFTAKLFRANLMQFQFVFSWGAFVRSIVYFGLIFVIVMILNVFMISKCRLIDLIYGEKKNETPKVGRLTLSVVLFILSIAALVASYIMIIDNGLTSIDIQFFSACFLAFIGTFLFFMSLAGFLLKLIQCNKKFYLKELNLFVLRQTSSKVNTTFISMTFICLMLAVTIVALSSGMAVNQAMRAELKNITPYDVTIENFDTEKTPTITSLLLKNGMLLDNYAEQFEEGMLYEDESFKEAEILALDQAPMKNRYLLEAVNSEPCPIMNLSDFNRMYTIQGKSPVTLADNEYFIVSNNKDFTVMIDAFLKSQFDVTVFSTEVSPKFDKSLMFTRYNMAASADFGTIIVPDYVTASEQPVTSFVNLNLRPEVSQEQFAQHISEIIKSENLFRYLQCSTRQKIFDVNTGLSAIMTFLTVYISIIFLLTSAAILALQQLTETADNKSRYALLSKLGADSRMIGKALFTQISIFFCVPIVLAIVHGIVGIYVANKVIVIFGDVNVLPNCIFTAVVFLIIYGGYFFATNLSSKTIISRS